MIVKSTPSARAMPGMEGRYMLMPSGLTAAIAMSNAMKDGLAIGFSGAAAVIAFASEGAPIHVLAGVTVVTLIYSTLS